MQRRSRLAARLVPAASLVLCLGTLYVWGRSYRTMDSLDRYRQHVGGRDTYHDTMGFFSARGAFGVGYLAIDAAAQYEWPADGDWKWMSLPATVGGWPRVSFLGFGYWNTAVPVTGTAGKIHPVGVQVPYWLPTVLFAIAPTVWAHRARLERRRRRRLRDRLCEACGYDLRAASDRCPECGHPVPAARTAVPA